VKQKFKEYYKNVVLETAKLSHAKRLKVGAIAVKNNRIISTGYNGTPSGWDNECENKYYPSWAHMEQYHEDWKNEFPFIDCQGDRYSLVTKQEVLHAEHNLIAKLAQSNESSKDAVIFCTVSPCIECAKLIQSAGIKEFYYINDYRSNDGLKFLVKCGVKVEKL
jgi:dCMP deaminase